MALGPKKKCPKCSANNDGAALTCNLCGQKLPAGPSKTTLEAFELEPRQWQGGTQRRRGDRGDETPAPSAPAAGAPTPAPPPAPVSGSGHFLCPPVGSPMRLDPTTSSFVFGRDEACSVRIASPKVSRRHAELRWRGTSLVLRDLNSQNGTYVNDRKLTEETPLADNDTLRMGDYIATYKFVPEGDDIANAKGGGETAIMDAVSVFGESKHDEGGALTGDAAILPIQEVLRRLQSLHATGTLALDVGGTKGEIKLADGRAIEGFYAGLEGQHAIQAMSSLTKGRFRFDPDPDAPPPRPVPSTARMDRPPSNDGTAGSGVAPRPAGVAPAGAPRPNAPGPRPSSPPPAPGAPGAPRPAAPPGGGPPGAARPGPPPAPGAPGARPGPRPSSPPV